MSDLPAPAARTLRVARRTAGLGGEAAQAWNIHVEARRREQAGEDIILLSVGDPDFPTPRAVRDAAKAALDASRTHYAEVVGQQALRAAVAAWHARTSGPAVEPGQVVVFAGAQNALYAAMQCLVDPGDEVVVFSPTYVTYPATVAAAGGTLRTVPLRAENRFHLDPADLRAALTPATRCILWNAPNNPTGMVANARDLHALRAACVEHDLWLVADEVYAGLVHDGEHRSPAALPGMAERTVVVSSLSKSHAMTGWRLGWLVCPPPLVEHVANLTLCMLYGAPPFVQDAATVALTADLPELAAMRERYRARRDLVCGQLDGVGGLRCARPEGGMFVMLDVRGTGMGAGSFAAALLAAEGVALLPGDAFGGAAAGHVRLALAVADARLAEACARIARFAPSAASR